MKAELGCLGTCFNSKKPLPLHFISSSRWPPSTSIAAGASGALASLVLITTVLLMNGCCFFPLQPAADLLFPDDDDNTAAHAMLNWTLKHSNTPSGLLSACDLWQGEWVPDSSPPLYTNQTCPHEYMLPNQNCVQNGRPDMGYLSWRWRPFDCELPPFNASLFLNLMRGKKVALIGDSLARNQLHAFLCSLSQVEAPHNVFYDFNDYSKWIFPSYNFTLTHIWSPFLVNYTVEQDNGTEQKLDLFTLHLDVLEVQWVTQLTEQDVAIVSTGYWFYRKSLYFVNNTLVGGTPHSGHNVMAMDMLSAMRIALANVLKHMTTEYGGITMLRTVTVDHFEHGGWYDGGVCNRTSPFSQQGGGTIPPIPAMNQRMNTLQTEEFEKAMAYAHHPNKLKLLNVTYGMHLRPDGHPGQYRSRKSAGPAHDCLHWCMPGPIDMWNQLVLYMLQTVIDR